MACVNEGSQFYLPPTRFFHKWNVPHLPLLPAAQHHHTSPVLIFHPTEGRRLSWLQWLVTNQGSLLDCSQ